MNTLPCYCVTQAMVGFSREVCVQIIIGDDLAKILFKRDSRYLVAEFPPQVVIFLAPYDLDLSGYFHVV